MNQETVRRFFDLSDQLESEAARIMSNPREEGSLHEVTAACVLMIVSTSILEVFGDYVETKGSA